MVFSPVVKTKRAPPMRVRFLIVLMGSLCPVVCYISRQNLSMAIIAMVNESSLATTTHETLDLDNHHTCPTQNIVERNSTQGMPTLTYGPRYEWNQFQKSFIFEAFFWTYVLCQIPAGRFAEIIGAKYVLLAATLGSSLLSAISPWAASMHVHAFSLVRALMGICQAALYPACYSLYTQWLPPSERSRALPVLGAGAYVGSIITITITGYFSELPRFGWEFAFYIPSIVCGLWSIVWMFVGSSEPRTHKFISKEEIEYIETRMETKKTSSDLRKKLSWLKLARSQHIWVMSIACLASNWSFSITLLLLPTYLNHVLFIPPFKNSLINSIFYMLFCITSPIIGAVSSMMVETRTFGLNRLQTRKFFQSIALFSQTICFVAIPLIGCHTNLVLGILYVQIVLFSFINGGEVQMPSEITLDFAGTVYAIGNSVGSSTGFIIPRVHSLIVENSYDKSQWNTFFYIAAFVSAIGGLIFLMFARNDLQDFSKPEIKEQDNVDKIKTLVSLEKDLKFMPCISKNISPV